MPAKVLNKDAKLSILKNKTLTNWLDMVLKSCSCAELKDSKLNVIIGLCPKSKSAAVAGKQALRYTILKL